MITFIVQLCYQVCTKRVYCGSDWFVITVTSYCDNISGPGCVITIDPWVFLVRVLAGEMYCFYSSTRSHKPDLLQGFLGWIWRQWATAWHTAFKCMIHSTMSEAELKQQQHKAAILDCTNSTLLLLTNYLKYPREMWKI